MTQRWLESRILQVLKMVMVCGSVIALLIGCSSRLKTTVVSSGEAPEVQVTHRQPEPLVVEEVVPQPIQKEVSPDVPVIDIPVEEPARPLIRREFSPEIFAKSKAPDAPEISSPLEPSPEPVEPAIEGPAVGVPPITFEPELPTRPTLRDDQAPPTQVAKVMPQEPAEVEIKTETLKEALSDIYFDYDRFSIREDAVALLEANAQLLTEELADKNIVIEGHCDERGTQSYNIVLGERRANAAKSFLENLGISGDKLQVVSYGKDKPFCREHTEECWQENRRGHFVIK